MMKIRDMFKSVLVAFAVLCVFSSHPFVARAQDQAPAADPGGDDADSGELSSIASDSDDYLHDGYVPPTYKNLIQSYWALGMYDMSDDKAIDSYLMVYQCDLYRKYHLNEFELTGLRDATRKSITASLSTFPLRFEVMIPMGIEEYDLGRGVFGINPKSVFVNLKRLEVATNNPRTKICPEAGKINFIYPINFIFSLNSPFTITEFHTDPKVAEFYIQQQEKESPSHPDRARISSLSRLAYLRLNVTFNQFKSFTKTDAQTPMMAEIFGKIDNYQVFGDRGKTLLLYDSRADKDKAKDRLQQDKKVSLPTGPLIQAGGGEAPPSEESQRQKASSSTPSGADSPSDAGAVSPETGGNDFRFALPPDINQPAPVPASGTTGQ